jgi:hypothetical protein
MRQQAVEQADDPRSSVVRERIGDRFLHIAELRITKDSFMRIENKESGFPVSRIRFNFETPPLFDAGLIQRLRTITIGSDEAKIEWDHAFLDFNGLCRRCLKIEPGTRKISRAHEQHRNDDTYWCKCGGTGAGTNVSVKKRQQDAAREAWNLRRNQRRTQ